ncbi:hypothetical protein Purlil1_13049 [Purpureocillium lilacinum]|uniref:Uncharacterized protein n=1 Tax=Purpureocillium lilacinum TaxID=33203 RepID=A0ABR0BFC3_PURLI|nr:hypothetical protein Purlil1_13049 [Purpureocillium lilacinum]
MTGLARGNTRSLADKRERHRSGQMRKRKFAGLQKHYRRPVHRQTRPTGPPHSQGPALPEALSGPSPSACTAHSFLPRLPFASQGSKQGHRGACITPTFSHQGHNVGFESNNDEDDNESEEDSLRLMSAAMEPQLLPTSLPRCKHKRQAQAKSRSLSARSLSALISDEKLRGGGRSLLIRKYARMLLPRPARYAALAACAEAQGVWAFTRCALARHTGLENTTLNPAMAGLVDANGWRRQAAPRSLRTVDACCPGACRVGAGAATATHCYPRDSQPLHQTSGALLALHRDNRLLQPGVATGTRAGVSSWFAAQSLPQATGGEDVALARKLLTWESELWELVGELRMQKNEYGSGGLPRVSASPASIRQRRRAGYLSKSDGERRNDAHGRWVARRQGVGTPANDGGWGSVGVFGCARAGYLAAKSVASCPGPAYHSSSQLRGAAQGTAPQAERLRRQLEELMLFLVAAARRRTGGCYCGARGGRVEHAIIASFRRRTPDWATCMKSPLGSTGASREAFLSVAGSTTPALITLQLWIRHGSEEERVKVQGSQ